MPIADGSKQEHRVKCAGPPTPFSVMIARPVSKDEVKRTPAAQAALQKEWDRLRAAGCWDEAKVREWSEVAANARSKNTAVHVGMIFKICVEKAMNWELVTPTGSSKGMLCSRVM